MRTVNELLARADELRRMAQTARTADVHTALMALAERFEALALKRSAAQGDHQSTPQCNWWWWCHGTISHTRI
jgi:hypothetical protein